VSEIRFERLSDDGGRARAEPPAARRVGTAAAVGNFLEWFDFALYGFFAVAIGAAFFPP
jgi:MFS transporter, MHS family, proline/betaine transporter